MCHLSKYPLNVFLADDDSDDRELFIEAAKETNPDIIIQAFSDGNKLIDHLITDESDPDMIFLDINMPLKNGKECLMEIRSAERYKTTPVIMFSTSLDAKDINDTFDAGANLFISKPGSFRTQVDVFRQVFHLFKNDLLIAKTVADFVLAPVIEAGRRTSM